MQTIVIDVLDGKGLMQVAVDGHVNMRRLESFMKWAATLANRLAEAQDRINELENQNGN